MTELEPTAPTTPAVPPRVRTVAYYVLLVTSALVLLTTKEVALADVRAKLLEAGFPNLWVPKLILRVDAIPILGTGKTDLKSCRTLAIERAAALAEA